MSLDQQYRKTFGDKRDRMLDLFYEAFYHALPSRDFYGLVQDGLKQFAAFKGSPQHKTELLEAVQTIYREGIPHHIARHEHSITGGNEYTDIVNCLYLTATGDNDEILDQIDSKEVMTSLLHGLTANVPDGTNHWYLQSTVYLAKTASTRRRFSEPFRSAFLMLPLNKQRSIQSEAGYLERCGSKLASEDEVIKLITPKLDQVPTPTRSSAVHRQGPSGQAAVPTG